MENLFRAAPCTPRSKLSMQVRWPCLLIILAAMITGEEVRRDEKHVDLDFVDLDRGAVVAPFRWQLRNAPPINLAVIVLIDGQFQEEILVDTTAQSPVSIFGDFAGAEALPVGQHQIVLKLADSGSGTWVGVESPQRVLIVDAQRLHDVTSSSETSFQSSELNLQEKVLEAKCELPASLDAHAYLPPRHCKNQPREIDNECVLALRRDLHSAQHKQCRRLVTTTIAPWGFANSLHLMALQLQRARKLGLTMTWHGSFLYSHCESRNFTCSFCNSSSCPFEAITSCGSGEEAEAFDEALKDTFEDAWEPEAAFVHCFRGPHALMRYVSTLTGYLFQPSAAVRSRVKALTSALELPSRYLGVHIRHGDACMGDGETDTRGCYGIPAFAEALHTLGELYDVSNVYVATDNPDAMSLLQQLLPRMRVVHNTLGRRAFLSAGVLGEQELNATVWSMVEHKLAGASPDTRQAQMEDILVDALILSRCQAFVGQLKSHMARLFLELAINEQMRLVPYISIDSSSWCWGNWGPVKC